MEPLKIVGFCVFLSVCYGVAHDVLTAHICVEYFTIAHPRILPTENPMVLGLFWGVVASWWVGALLGSGLALAARAGQWPRIALRELRASLLILLGAMAVVAVAAGLINAAAASMGFVALIGPIAKEIPAAQHVPFLGVFAATIASYAAGAVGAVVMVIITVIRRGRRAVQEVLDRTTGAAAKKNGAEPPDR
jgi:hypothetical protein